MVAMHVRGLDRLSLELGGFFVLFFYSFDFLLLDVYRGDFHAQNDIFDLRLSEACNIHVVFLGVVGQNEVLQLYLDLDPLLIGQSWPNMMWLRDDRSIGCEDNFCSFRIDVESSQNEDQSTKCCKALHGLEPVIIEVEQEHLRLRSFENSVAELLQLENRLVRQLELTTLDDDVWEI